jgi:hypothetical protein
MKKITCDLQVLGFRNSPTEKVVEAPHSPADELPETPMHSKGSALPVSHTSHHEAASWFAGNASAETSAQFCWRGQSSSAWFSSILYQYTISTTCLIYRMVAALNFISWLHKHVSISWIASHCSTSQKKTAGMNRARYEPVRLSIRCCLILFWNPFAGNRIDGLTRNEINEALNRFLSERKS